MKRLCLSLLSLLAAILSLSLMAFGAEPLNTDPTQQSTAFPTVLIGLAALLIFAKLGGELFERLGQPAVLGELVAGIAIGNLLFFGIPSAEFLKNSEIIGTLAEIGVIVLLFEVGLGSNVKDLLKVGWSSMFVAVAGVIAPFFLGWLAASFFLPDSSQLTHIFIGAILCATSVGITARVLKDLGYLSSKESRIILGAAVIDDVLGLIILAVIAGAIRSTQAGLELGLTQVVLIAVKSAAFLLGAVAIGHFVVPHLFRHAGKFERRGVLLALSLAFCFVMAWIASLVGLAPIVGAFAAGLVLDDAHFETFRTHEQLSLDQLLTPVSSLLVPIFFVVMGLKVDLSFVLNPEILLFAGALTLAAIIGKQVCSFATVEKGINRLPVGLGMIPRGEVGLIMAGVGMRLVVPNANGVLEPIVSSSTFGAVILMVITTTIVTPTLLKWSLNNTSASEIPDQISGVFVEATE